MIVRVTLTEEQRGAIGKGAFVRVDLGGAREIRGVRARSALIGRAAGEWRAFVNVCRHQAVPLDFAAGTAMADDGYHLLCHQHGALYRPTDGACVMGPCKGEKLLALQITEDGGDLAIDCG